MGLPDREKLVISLTVSAKSTKSQIIHFYLQKSSKFANELSCWQTNRTQAKSRPPLLAVSRALQCPATPLSNGDTWLPPQISETRLRFWSMILPFAVKDALLYSSPVFETYSSSRRGPVNMMTPFPVWEVGQRSRRYFPAHGYAIFSRHNYVKHCSDPVYRTNIIALTALHGLGSTPKN